jgi:hypothetical protein
MSGGITQLIAIGAQDTHIVGNPEVSFFRSTYRRHTNFSQVVDRQTIQGNPNSGGISVIRIERKGDMLGYTYFTVKNSSGETITFPDNLFSKVELLIGGQLVDEQDDTFSRLIASQLLVGSSGKAVNSQDKFYPLHFFFCENWQSALPLIALQYHDVELRITWGDTVDTSNQIECFCNFVYLDAAERDHMASQALDMLVTQTQKVKKSGTYVQEMTFNHPVKFLVSNAALVLSPSSSTLKLQLNGSDVSNPRSHDPHFSSAMVYHHCPYAVSSANIKFLYPFCLETNKTQPSGTLNFSRIDTARFVSTAKFDQADIYAVNYNILRIQNGMGGLMYAN